MHKEIPKFTREVQSWRHRRKILSFPKDTERGMLEMLEYDEEQKYIQPLFGRG